MLIAPSILSADFGKLNEEIDELNKTNCDYIHIDVMDGHFVPNLTFGKCVIEAVAKRSKKPLDIHLMVKNIDFFVDMMIELKPYSLSFHIEEEKHINKMIHKIKDNNTKAGIALNPHTSQDSLEYILRYIDFVLLMSVNPGFGGQKFIENTINKVRALRSLIDRKQADVLIEVDGGVNLETGARLVEAGVDVLVTGSTVFKAPDFGEMVHKLKSLAH